MLGQKLNKKKCRNLALLLACLVILKIVFVFLGSRYSGSFFSNLFTSVLNTENIVSLTNISRKNAGLKELKISQKLAVAAQQKAEDMLKNQYFTHIAPSQKTPWDFMDDAGYAFLFAGENLAINFNSAEEVTTGWLASPGHKENILNNKYTEIGVGIAEGRYLGVHTAIAVQMFGKPLKSRALMSKPPTKKSRKVASPMKRKSLLARSFVKPMVKGISVENSISAQSFLNIFYIYLVVCSMSIVIYRYFKERYFQDKTLSAFTVLVIGASLALAAF
jgi:hypothetical protein